MKLKRLKIESFGPLKDREYCLGEGLNLFFGGNETGKTSIVDLIVRELFKSARGSGTRDLTPFKGAERYRDTDFEGSLILEHEGASYGTEKGAKKLKPDEVIGDILISRLLCIESGDLTVPQDSGFFESLKDALSGTKGGTDKIKKALFAKAGLPSSGENTKGSTFYNEFIRLKEDLNKYNDLLTDIPKIHDLENSLSELDERLKSLQRSRLTNAKKDFEAYLEAQGKIGAFSKIREEDLKRIAKLTESREKLAAGKEAQDKEIRDLSARIVEDEMAYNEKKSLLKDMSGRYASRLYLEFEEDFTRYVRTRKLSRNFTTFEIPSVAAFSTLFAASAILLIYNILKNTGSYFWPFMLASLGFVIFFFWKFYKTNVKTLESLRRRVKIQSAELKLPIAPDIENMDTDVLLTLRSDKDRLLGEVNALEQSLKRLKVEIPKRNSELNESSEGIDIIDKKIGAILEDSGEKSLESLESKVKEKNQLQTAIALKRESIEKLLGPDESLWESQIDGVDSETTEMIYDPNILDGLMSKRSSLYEELQKVKKPFIHVGCDSHYDIYGKIEECEIELSRMNLTLEASEICKAIFADIDAERDKVFSDVFENKESPLFAYLETILGRNRIKRVSLKACEFSVETVSDEQIKIEALSRGTHDQFLFAFRLSLLEKIFKSPHFVLLDDPFLTSDRQRREKLAAAVKEFVNRGWQVVYFTFDEQTRDLLLRDNPETPVFDLPNLF